MGPRKKNRVFLLNLLLGEPVVGTPGSRGLGACLRGRTATQGSKKGSEKVLGRVLGKGSQKGSERGLPAVGFTVKQGSEKGSQKGF